MGILDTLISFVHGVGASVLPFILLLGVLIFVHEMGHFLVAKYFGVRVEVFSMGFGKKLLKRKYGETEYCLSLIPLGGYVKMFGDEPGSEISESEKQYSFTHKPVFQRIAVVLAGPLMNFFFAILVFFVVASVGEETRLAVLGDVAGSSPAAAMGFKSGDRILSINEQAMLTWEEMIRTVERSADQKLVFKVERYQPPSSTPTINPVEVVELTATPKLSLNPNILSLSEYVGQIDGFSFMHRAPIVGVVTGSAADKAGFKTGDRILSIGRLPIVFYRDIEPAYAEAQGAGKDPVEVLISRESGGAPHEERLVLKPDSSLLSAGLESSELFLAKVVEATPAARAGLLAGDRVVSISGQKLNDWEDLLRVVKSFKGEQPLKISINRGGKIENFELSPELTNQTTLYGVKEKRFTLGVLQWADFVQPPMVTLKSANPLLALKRGLDRSIDVSAMTVVSFLRLIQAKISPKQISGVISIGQAASETFKIGIAQFLQMMGLISINLFILNLLPIPMLDGGHLVFYSIEALRGAPLSLRKIEVAQQVGLVLLMSLMVFALYNDFSRLLGLQ